MASVLSVYVIELINNYSCITKNFLNENKTLVINKKQKKITKNGTLKGQHKKRREIKKKVNDIFIIKK